MKSAFKPIVGPFGGKDEQKTQDAFVEYVGGMRQAEQLSRLWQDSYATPWPPGHQYYHTKSEVFRKKALDTGFTNRDVDAFLCL